MKAAVFSAHRLHFPDGFVSITVRRHRREHQIKFPAPAVLLRVQGLDVAPFVIHVFETRSPVSVPCLVQHALRKIQRSHLFCVCGKFRRIETDAASEIQNLVIRPGKIIFPEKCGGFSYALQNHGGERGAFFRFPAELSENPVPLFRGIRDQLPRTVFRFILSDTEFFYFLFCEHLPSFPACCPASA